MELRAGGDLHRSEKPGWSAGDTSWWPKYAQAYSFCWGSFVVKLFFDLPKVSKINNISWLAQSKQPSKKEPSKRQLSLLKVSKITTHAHSKQLFLRHLHDAWAKTSHIVLVKIMTSTPGVEIRIAFLIFAVSYEIELDHYFCPEFVGHVTNQNILVDVGKLKVNFNYCNSRIKFTKFFGNISWVVSYYSFIVRFVCFSSQNFLSFEHLWKIRFFL